MTTERRLNENISCFSIITAAIEAILFFGEAQLFTSVTSF